MSARGRDINIAIYVKFLIRHQTCPSIVLKNHAFTFPYSGRYIGLKDFFKRAVEQSKEIVDMYSGIFHVLAKLRESEGLKKVKATDSKSLYKLIILAGGLDPNSYKALYSEPFWEFKKKLDAVDRKSTRLNSSHSQQSRMPSSA